MRQKYKVKLRPYKLMDLARFYGIHRSVLRKILNEKGFRRIENSYFFSVEEVKRIFDLLGEPILYEEDIRERGIFREYLIPFD